MNEAEWQSQVIDLARLYGWTCAHFRPAKTEKGWRTPVQADGKGFPDLVLVRKGDLIFAELKAEKGRLSPEQTDWLEQLGQVEGIDTYLWRPSHFDAVNERLR